MFDGDVQYEEGKATARKFVSGSEPFALGHYAGDPIYPGVLTLELMMQLGDRLLLRETGYEPRRMRIIRAQYLGMVRPGDRLDVTASVNRKLEGEVRISARVSTDHEIRARATLDYVIEI